eukprot:14065358-Alexandrium_andersonii.AAC.1
MKFARCSGAGSAAPPERTQKQCRGKPRNRMMQDLCGIMQLWAALDRYWAQAPNSGLKLPKAA